MYLQYWREVILHLFDNPLKKTRNMAAGVLGYKRGYFYVRRPSDMTDENTRDRSNDMSRENKIYFVENLYNNHST